MHWNVYCFRWREVQLMPLSSNSKSLSVTRPAKQRKLDPSQNNSVFFTSGDEPVVRSSTTSADVNPLDSGSDTDSEVLLSQFCAFYAFLFEIELWSDSVFKNQTK